MKNKIRITLPLICLLSFGVSAESLFAGQWSGEDSNVSTLTLNISQHDKNITGTYCFITQKGNKIDWHLTQPPQQGEYYAPENYTLVKEKDISAAVSRKLITDKFTVTLTNKCGDFNNVCDDIFYLGIRKSDNSIISLHGKSVTDSSGEVVGADFVNGNVIYKVNYNPPRLIVTQNKKVLIEQEGKWIE